MYLRNTSLPLLSVSLPPDKAPKGRSPLGVRPFNCRTLSLSSLICDREQKQSKIKINFMHKRKKTNLVWDNILKKKTIAN